MVEVLLLPSRLDVDWLPDMLEHAARMLMIAAMKASLITMNPFKSRAVNPAAADAAPLGTALILRGHKRVSLSDIAPSPVRHSKASPANSERPVRHCNGSAMAATVGQVQVRCR
ncbi:MAG TPA: hypothetical protein VN663_07360 [Ramlibacter sp.]|nr:hypothetical protein [Ramlibacter sp.]